MKPLRNYYCCLFLIFFISCGKSIHKEYKIALEKVENQEYQSAIELLTDIIKKDSNLHEVFQSRAVCYFKTENYKSAIVDFQKAYSINKNPQLQFNLGITNVHIEDYSNAIIHFSKYEKSNDLNPVVWLQMGFCFSRLNDYENALPYFIKAKDSFPDSIQLLKNIGICQFQLSNYSAAVEELKEYLDTIKNDKSSFEMIGYSFYELGRYQKAKISFDQMIEIGLEMDEKTKGLYLKNLLKVGENQYMNKKYIASLQTFSEIITLDPVNNEAYYNRGLVQLHYEKRIEACEDFNLAFSNGNTNAISMMKKNCQEYFD